MKKTSIGLFAPAATLAVALCFCSCGKEQFHLNGTIANATDSVLYLENMALDGAKVVDSVKLDDKGDFAFSLEAPADAPEFYRLRIAQQIISLSVDSTETITVKATYPDMASNYQVEGSENCQKIRELSLMQMKLQAEAQRVYNAPELNAQAVEDSVRHLIDQYKASVLTNYVYKEPMKAYSYFALFQGIVVGNAYLMVFNPRTNTDDVRPFSAVATSWDQLYPKSLRGENLHNIAIEGMKTQRIVKASQQGLEVDASKVTEADIIDIVLPDNNGVTRRLTDLKGKVVLLDFHVFATDGSSERILALRELYNKYHDRGLEIFQVSLDEDAHFWKTQTAALPWVSVRDDKGASQPYLYQVHAVPVDYIINRDNQVVLGPREIKNLETDIAKYL
ncbi:MAG: AhpC/TSA family protein [Prevotella sp.]|nr:AhpC/TSA family protein [Prevotella sp.]